MTEQESSERPTPGTPGPAQAEMPFAIVQGEPYYAPMDLYIPPDALEVFLEAFEGPLDLLLYLIRRQNLDILDIPVAEVTRQYMGYIRLMEELRLELASDYLVMASVLTEIKSRMLLPRPVTGDDEDEEDPRAELVRRLQEYERYKRAAEDLDALPRVDRDVPPVRPEPGVSAPVRVHPTVELDELLRALQSVLSRAETLRHHRIEREPLSVRERMTRILSTLPGERFMAFTELLDPGEGRRGVVVSFVAVLELIKEMMIEMVQNEPYGPVYVRAAGALPGEVGDDGASAGETG